MSNFTLDKWMKTPKPESELIVQASLEDGSDGITNASIGMAWQYVAERGNSERAQIGDHSKLVLCAVNINTDLRRRGYGQFNRLNHLAVLAKNGIENERIEPSDYFRSLPQYKFVISPEGNGVDCHRHYEALMAGCIPIVEDHPLIRAKYGDVPILYTLDYSEICEEYLLQKYAEMLHQTWDYSKLFLSYWPESEQQLIVSRGNLWCQRCVNEAWYRETKVYREPTVPFMFHENEPSLLQQINTGEPTVPLVRPPPLQQINTDVIPEVILADSTDVILNSSI